MEEKLTQSNNILGYTTGKHNTCTDTEEKKRGVDIMKKESWISIYSGSATAGRDRESLPSQCLK